MRESKVVENLAALKMRYEAGSVEAPGLLAAEKPSDEEIAFLGARSGEHCGTCGDRGPCGVCGHGLGPSTD